MKAQDNDIPKLKQSTIEKHEVKVQVDTVGFIKAMEKKSESEAIAFAEWINNNAYELTSDVWCVRLDKEEKEYSMKELYQLFKKDTK